MSLLRNILAHLPDSALGQALHQKGKVGKKMLHRGSGLALSRDFLELDEINYLLHGSFCTGRLSADTRVRKHRSTLLAKHTACCIRFSLKFGLEATPLPATSAEFVSVLGLGLGWFTLLLATILSHTILFPRVHWLVRSGQTSPHKPRFVVSHSTCPPPRAQLCNRSCRKKQQLLPLPG